MTMTMKIDLTTEAVTLRPSDSAEPRTSMPSTPAMTPIVAAIVGKPNFGALTFTINHSQFLYGDLINAAITFASVAAAVYFFVVVPLNKLAERRARGQAPAEDPVPPDIALLTEIRDLIANQGAAPKGPTGAA